MINPLMIVWYWGVLVIAYAVAVSIRNSSGGPRYNPGRVAMLAIVGALIVRYAQVSATVDAQFANDGLGSGAGPREVGRALFPFLVAVYLSSRYKKRLRAALTIPQASEKKCPFCAETVKYEAVVCRYCGRDLPTVAVP